MSKDIFYTENHEWLEINGNTGTVGITDHAQKELGDIVFVELPNEGESVDQGDDIVVLESVKSVSDVYAPVSGEVVAVNEEVTSSPELINEAPTEKGWLVELTVRDEKQLDNLLDEEAYNNLITE